MSMNSRSVVVGSEEAVIGIAPRITVQHKTCMYAVAGVVARCDSGRAVDDQGVEFTEFGWRPGVRD